MTATLVPASSVYKAIVHTEEGGGYWAEVANLPGCFTQGGTLDEVYRNLTEAIACSADKEQASIKVSILEMAP